ncbi:hypothetical protein B0H19DRAFT_1132234 [Mycena capillaripes]|nr:hypothetical protein B0H19DRAFT_1132234 [Mycena capillaripes]
MPSLIWGMFVGLLFSGTVLQAVHAQTLYRISEMGKPTTEVLAQSVSISAVGVGADGATTYVEELVESYVAIEYSDTTVTVLSTPAPEVTVTFVEDASNFHESVPFQTGDFLETCAFGQDGHGTCIDKFPYPSSTLTRTVSGTVVPYYIFAAAASPSTTNHAPSSVALLPLHITLSALVLVLFVDFL